MASVQNLGRELFASYAFVERNFNLIKRYFGWEVVFLFYTLVNALTIGLIGVGQGDAAVLYLVIGALFWGFLSVLFNEVSNSVQWERWEGTIEYTFMAPVHRLTYLGGMCLFAITYGILRTLIILGGVALFFNLSLAHANAWAALVVLVVSSASFMGLGLVAAVLPLMSPERGAQATNIIQGLILLVSGVYYPISALPSWLQPLAVLSPATYALRAARAALLENASISAVAPDLLRLVVFAVVLIPLGFYTFRWGEHDAMRTGKLKRNG